MRLWWRRRWGRWIAGAAVAVVVGVGVLVLLTDEPPPRLELVALGADGGYSPVVEIPTAWVDTAAGGPEVVARVPLVLAVRNRGGGSARPARLNLSVPLQFRIRSNDSGWVVRRMRPAGPLVEYRMAARIPEVRRGRGSTGSASRDTLWLDVVVPEVYCVAMSDSVPAFVSAPPMPAEAVTDLRMFYSLSGGDLAGRQTGLLRVRIDPRPLRRAETDSIETFPVAVDDAGSALPRLDGLRLVGTRRSLCGEPARPMEFTTFVWETGSGGRFFVLHYGGVPRKYLFDLDRDSVIEREMGDPDGDGHFESSARIRMRTPSFLLPEPEPDPFRGLAVDPLTAEQYAALDLFGEARRGPYRPAEPPSGRTPDLGILRPDVLAHQPGDEDDRPPAPATPRPRPRPAPGTGDAGPDVLGDPAEPRADAPRRGEPADRPEPRREQPAPGQPSEDQPQADQPQADEPQAEEPESDEPELLGVPVDSAGGTGGA